MIDDSEVMDFVAAIKTGDMAALRLMLEASPDLATDRFGDAGSNRSSLHILTDWPGMTPDREQVARILVAAGADPNAQFVGAHTETPLHWAASSDDDMLVAILIELGANIEAAGGVLGSGPPLDDAIIFQQWRAAEVLVDRGALVAFWHTAAGGRRSTVELLLQHGSDRGWVGWDHLTAGQAASRNGHHDVATLLA